MSQPAASAARHAGLGQGVGSLSRFSVGTLREYRRRSFRRNSTMTGSFSQDRQAPHQSRVPLHHEARDPAQVPKSWTTQVVRSRRIALATRPASVPPPVPSVTPPAA